MLFWAWSLRLGCHRNENIRDLTEVVFSPPNHSRGMDGLKTEGMRGNRDQSLGKVFFSFPLSVFGFILFFPCQSQKGPEFWVQNSQDQRIRGNHSGWKLWSYHRSRSLLLPPWETCANTTAWSSCSGAKVLLPSLSYGKMNFGGCFCCCFCFFFKETETWLALTDPFPGHGNHN